MKKLMRILLAAMLVLGCLGAITACGGAAKAPEIPDGYQEYSNGTLSFAYPADWSENNGSVVTLVNPTGIGNNITVVYEAKTDLYDDMTVESFNTLMKPTYEAMGMTVSNVAVEEKTTNGLDVTRISYDAKVAGQTLSQTAFITTVGGNTYTVTVTEMTADDELVETVFQTLYAKK